MYLRVSGIRARGLWTVVSTTGIRTHWLYLRVPRVGTIASSTWVGPSLLWRTVCTRSRARLRSLRDHRVARRKQAKNK
ncbi:MAG: hypothetical protein ACRD3K_12585 [Edaphobacter sp.]